MAMNMNVPKMTNWRVWGGVAVASIIVIVALGYGFDGLGGGVTEEVAPAIEQTAPATE